MWADSASGKRLWNPDLEIACPRSGLQPRRNCEAAMKLLQGEKDRFKRLLLLRGQCLRV